MCSSDEQSSTTINSTLLICFDFCIVDFVFLITGNYKLSIAGTGLFLVFEYIININISSKSAFAFLKYINISNVLFPGQSYYIYENWGTDNFITDILIGPLCRVNPHHLNMEPVNL